MGWMRTIAFGLVILCPLVVLAGKTCYSPEDALLHRNKDVCVAAHVYDVVELADGTRFLDLCSPETPDEVCRFTVMSANGDRKSVGDLSQYRQQDIQIRGVVRPFGGRAEIMLSDARQFRGGSERFRPNPALLHGFSAEDGRPAVSDPALRSGHHRSVFQTAH
jgi:hypothetical protein